MATSDKKRSIEVQIIRHSRGNSICISISRRRSDDDVTALRSALVAYEVFALPAA